jgi:DNA-binding response OmpR family regulator
MSRKRQIGCGRAPERSYTPAVRILVVEDNRNLAANVLDYLKSRGHVADVAMDGVTGLHLALTGDFDAIVLDLGLPRMDGTELCKRLRDAQVATPVLMLTARAEIEDRIDGLELGGDDYLVKPIALRELEARLRALVRRSQGGLPQPRLQVADLVMDERTMQVTRRGHPIALARLDYQLLRVLMRESPAVVPRARLEAELWGEEPPQTDALRAHIHVLRRAIDHSFSPPLLHTVHSVGYRLASENARPQ